MNYSAIMAFSEFVEDFLNRFDKGEEVCAVILDLSKEFNSVDRKILLNRLECYGVGEKMQLFIKSNLTERAV